MNARCVGGCLADWVHYIPQFEQRLLLSCRNVTVSFVIAILQASEPEEVSGVAQNIPDETKPFQLCNTKSDCVVRRP